MFLFSQNFINQIVQDLRPGHYKSAGLILERVYADVFHTEAALVRPQITCGTHALTVALSANLLPGDELLSPVGMPYDTLQEVIGIRESPCSLAEYGVHYRQVDRPPPGFLIREPTTMSAPTSEGSMISTNSP